MRAKNRKLIGPVPIAVVAVFALAVLLSAGLLVLIPGSTQAQTATGSLPDVTLDVGDTHEITAAMMVIMAEEDGVFPMGAQNFTIESDQDDPEDDDDQTTDDDNGDIETNSSGSNGRSGAISIVDSTGRISIPGGIASQDNAEQADNTARITVRANDANDDPLTPVRFDVTIVQNPFEDDGTPVTNPTGWAAASSSDCTVVTLTPDGTQLTSRAGNLTGTQVLVDGGACTTTGDSVKVTLQNNNVARTDDTKSTYLVYVTGGDSFSKVDGYEGKSGLNQELHEVEGQDALDDPGEAIITVSRSMADSKGKVYLYGYLDDLGNKRIKSDSEAFRVPDVDFVVRVQFVDGPALAFDANRDDKTFDLEDGSDDDVNGSTLRAPEDAEVTGGQDKDMDGYFDGMYMIDSGSDTEIDIIATIMDANSQPLNAGDKDSRVDFSVAYTAGSDITDSAADYNSRKVITKGSNTTSIAVSGWNSNNKAVKVTVSATYTSPTAPDGFDLGTVTLTRVADFASTADFTVYICEYQDDTTVAAAKGCAVGYKAKEDMRFGREDSFVVYGQFEDALGSKTEDSPELEVSGAAADALDKTVTSATGYSARASAGSVLVKVKKDAAFSDYTFTVTNGESGDDEVKQDLMISVAGPIDSYMVEGPENNAIELNSSGMFKVTAMDENGGVPDFGATAATDNMVTVAVQPTTALVTGLNAVGMLELDEDTGMGYFTVYVALNASHGDRSRVIVGSGAMQQILDISFGGNRAPMMGMAIADQMVDAGSMVMVQSNFSDPDGDMLSYTEMSDMMDVATATVDDMGMVTITGVAMGTATITVTATDPDGMYDMQTIMVTVMTPNMAPMAGDDVADQMVYVGAMVEVQSNFSDPDEDMLSYTATSDMMDVATASVDDMGMVTITGVAEGMATITVTATDPDGMYDMQTIMVTVMTPNMAPMAGDDVADQMVYVGAMVEVQSNFSDPDEDMLSYTATSDMMDVATASVDDMGMVTITGVAEGMATITVTATDPDGMYDMQTIMVTVMTPNMAPMAGDDVADQMVYVGAMVEVQSNFSDPDEDMLSYTATSDMMDVATATVDSAGMVTITGVAEGMATITVTASDPMGESAMQTIMVTVMMMPPMELGAAMDLTSTANDDGSITLMWTRGDNATHHFVSGNSAAVWEFAGGMSSHTVSIDKLVSGTEYTFYVISGRFMEADDGTWPGEWSSAGWTNAAKAMAQ